MAKVPEFLTNLNYNNDALEDMFSNGFVSSSFNEFNVIGVESDLDTVDQITSVTSSLISVPILSIPFDKDRIASSFNLEFTEFGEDVEVDVIIDTSSIEGILASDAVSDEINNVIVALDAESASLAGQLDILTELLENQTAQNISFTTKTADNYTRLRELIIGLRIQLGEGNDPSEFGDKFPFLPLTTAEKGLENPDPFPFSVLNMIEIPTGSDENTEDEG